MTGREAALRVLTACRREGAWADGALKATLAGGKLSSADAKLATNIVYGVLQNRILLDRHLAACCTQRPEHLEPILLDILRIGAYQILFLDRVPDSAAVNESVELAKANKKARAAGLVNAVLRKVAQRRPLALPADSVEALSIRTSHPKWLAARLVELLGPEEAEAFCKANNDAAPLTVQVNTLKATAAEVEEALRSEGVGVTPHPYLPDCLILSGTGDITGLDAFRKGLFWVQDAGAKMMALAAAPHGRVIDVCAAPGGKSFAAAALMGGEGEIFSCDIHPHKIKLIENGARRLGMANIHAELADGRHSREEWLASADTVLVDAPCSGLGIIRKKPDIRYKDPRPLVDLPRVQSAILDNAAGYVKPGGTLVYSTCTILPEENGQVTASFLERHGDFVPEPFTLPGVEGEQSEITLWPQRHGTDGFYICKMRRIEHD